MSNQRPSSFPEFRHTSQRVTPTLKIELDGICQACKFAEVKEQINWQQREEELLMLLEKHRRNDGHYDCIVPGSGGKDSAYASHILKQKYGMHPLTVTWPPIMYTDIGHQNFDKWIDVGGFDNITFRPNGRVYRLLSRLSIQNLLHPFQAFIIGQKNIAPQAALDHRIPLVFYGENEAEYGNPIADNSTAVRSDQYHSIVDINGVYLGGVSVAQLTQQHGLSLADLAPFLPPRQEDLDRAKVEVHYLGYYLKWTPQEAYYYASEHTGFEPSGVRNEGTFQKYTSLDDKVDGLHFYTTYIKFGVGRATYDASQEIRNKHLTREDGIALVKRFDGEFPVKYFQDVMDHLELDPQEFHDLCDKFRSPHLWKRSGPDWTLRHQIS